MDDFFVRIVRGAYVKRFITTYHYSQRIPQIQYAFGLFSKKSPDILLGAITYALPVGKPLNTKIPFSVLELNRVAMKINSKNLVSWFISKTFKELPKPVLLISFADSMMNHVGIIYQATNWIYTGGSTIKDNYIVNGKLIHNKTFYSLKNKPKNFKVVKGKVKHRYFLSLGSKTQKKKMNTWIMNNYEIQKYPKGDSIHYNMEDERKKRKNILNKKTLFNQENENK